VRIIIANEYTSLLVPVSVLLPKISHRLLNACTCNSIRSSCCI